MELTIYKSALDVTDSVENFTNFYYSLKMKYLASDLLDKGLTPTYISNAIVRAIKVANSSGIEVRKHFMPVFTEMNKEVIIDCKLSKLGYGLVLFNANPEITAVGQWQVKVLKKFFT